MSGDCVTNTRTTTALAAAEARVATTALDRVTPPANMARRCIVPRQIRHIEHMLVLLAFPAERLDATLAIVAILG